MRACATTTAEIEAQLAEIEKRRPPSAVEFRARTMERMGPVTDEAARRVLQRARETLRTRIAELGGEWRDAITAREGRASVDACIEQVNASSPARLRTICDDLAEQIAKDVQAAGDTLQTWVVDELRVAYQAHRSDDDSAPVIVSVAAGLADADNVPPSVRDVPLAATRDAFEQKRVGIGLGGAAAGAALGTLIFPGVGTAVGAMVGVLAGLVEGTGSLKRQAIERMRAHGAVVESEIAARLEGAVSSVARDLVASVDDTLERALARREGSIARLFDESDRAVARERQKVEELARIRASLAAQEDRFVALAGRAGSALHALAAARAGARRS
jgi:hypothetical protein